MLNGSAAIRKLRKSRFNVLCKSCSSRERLKAIDRIASAVGGTGLGLTATPVEPVVDRQALAGDVVSILGGEVDAPTGRSRGSPERLKQVILRVQRIPRNMHI